MRRFGFKPQYCQAVKLWIKVIECDCCYEDHFKASNRRMWNMHGSDKYMWQWKSINANRQKKMTYDVKMDILHSEEFSICFLVYCPFHSQLQLSVMRGMTINLTWIVWFDFTNLTLSWIELTLTGLSLDFVFDLTWPDFVTDFDLTWLWLDFDMTVFDLAWRSLEFIFDLTLTWFGLDFDLAWLFSWFWNGPDFVIDLDLAWLWHDHLWPWLDFNLTWLVFDLDLTLTWLCLWLGLTFTWLSLTLPWPDLDLNLTWLDFFYLILSLSLAWLWLEFHLIWLWREFDLTWLCLSPYPDLTWLDFDLTDMTLTWLWHDFVFDLDLPLTWLWFDITYPVLVLLFNLTWHHLTNQ